MCLDARISARVRWRVGVGALELTPHTYDATPEPRLVLIPRPPEQREPVPGGHGAVVEKIKKV